MVLQYSSSVTLACQGSYRLLSCYVDDLKGVTFERYRLDHWHWYPAVHVTGILQAAFIKSQANLQGIRPDPSAC